MNALAIDYGSKRIGLAVSVNGIIMPLPVIANNGTVMVNLQQVVKKYQVERVFVGLSEGSFRLEIKKFVVRLRRVLKLNIETVEESVSTIEAGQIYAANKKSKKDYKKTIDSIAAAVILRRVSD